MAGHSYNDESKDFRFGLVCGCCYMPEIGKSWSGTQAKRFSSFNRKYYGDFDDLVRFNDYSPHSLQTGWVTTVESYKYDAEHPLHFWKEHLPSFIYSVFAERAHEAYIKGRGWHDDGEDKWDMEYYSEDGPFYELIEMEIVGNDALFTDIRSWNDWRTYGFSNRKWETHDKKRFVLTIQAKASNRTGMIYPYHNKTDILFEVSKKWWKKNRAEFMQGYLEASTIFRPRSGNKFIPPRTEEMSFECREGVTEKFQNRPSNVGGFFETLLDYIHLHYPPQSLPESENKDTSIFRY